MTDSQTSPGPAARQAFEIGVRAAAVGALAVLGVLVWTGTITLFSAAFALVVLFPPYLLVVASALSKWLGLGKDVSDLRRVTRTHTPGERWK